MAHQVQAGNARPKIRSSAGTWFLGAITCGIYTVYWWHRTLSDLQQFESSNGTTSTIRPAVETTVLGSLLAVMVGAQVAMRETVTITNQLGQSMEVSQLTDAGMFVVLGILVAFAVMSARLRKVARRVMTQAGLLPEEQPGAVGFWAVALVLSVPGSSGHVQGGLNKLWERYPRWYPSIGGTKEEVLAGGGPVGAPAAMPAASPNLSIVAPVPLGVPGAAPSADAAAQAAAVLAELGARAQAGQLGAADGFRYAQAVEQVHGAEAAAPWYEYVANSDPSNADAMYRTGAWRVSRGDANGMQYLHRAAQDPAFRALAANAMATYLERSGRAAEAAQWRAYAA